MKILLFSLYGRSGMIHYASQLANALSKNNEVHILIPKYTDDSFFDKKVNLIRMSAPPSIIKTFFLSLNPFHFLRIMKKIKQINPDVVHILDNHPWYLMFLPTLRKFKVIVTQHDVSAHPGEFFVGKIAIFVNYILDKMAKTIIVHGEKMKTLMIKKGIPENKIEVLPHGDYSFFLKWKDDNVKEQPNSLLFFGRLLHYKGLDLMLESLKMIKKEFKDVKLIIAGEGDIEKYKPLITEDIKDNVEIINEYIPEEGVAPLFQRAAVVVLPYREASQSGIIPIAYAFKKPVVVTQVGSLVEVVDHDKTGILVEPNNTEKFAKAVVALLKDTSKMQEIGEGGYKKMKEILDWGKISEKLMKLY